MEEKVSKPHEPVISTNECYAALNLMKLMCRQIVTHGDVPDTVFEMVFQISENLERLDPRSTGKDSEVSALICSGLVPSFQRSPEKEAGRAILHLIAARGTQESQATGG